MKANKFIRVMAEWAYMAKLYRDELPWQGIIYNCTDRKSVVINDIVVDDNNPQPTVKLLTDQGEILINASSVWQLKLGKTKKAKTIFTHDLNT